MWFYKLRLNEPKLKETIEKSKKHNKSGTTAYGYEFILKNYDKISKENVISGNFLNKDKKNIILSYVDVNNDKYLNYLLLDGNTGKEISSYREENLFFNQINLDSISFDEVLEKLVLIGRNLEVGEYKALLKIYDVDEYKIKESDLNLENIKDDVKIDCIDGFNIKVESKELGKKYILEILKEQQENYIQAGYYREDGSLNANKEIFLVEVEDYFLKINLIK